VSEASAALSAPGSPVAIFAASASITAVKTRLGFW
jgi:hypothetical protein